MKWNLLMKQGLINKMIIILMIQHTGMLMLLIDKYRANDPELEPY